MNQAPNIQPLRIPSGWNVTFNEWRAFGTENPGSWLKEDLFQAIQVQGDYLVDAGWYGTYPDGEFIVQLIRGDFIDGHVLQESRTKSQQEAVLALESLLATPNP